MTSLTTDWGPLELLVLQPTPFCNIDCSYCYLPDRQSTQRMSLLTLEQIFRWVFNSGLVRADFTILWHAGEPLVIPVAFYEQAIELAERHNQTGFAATHSFQTNATLLDESWCDFFLRHQINLGVSVDGPAFLHDARRKTRQGKGTLDRVLRGIHLLNERQIPFFVISVLTAESLDYPDELFDFYQSHGICVVGFNVEEIEGPNLISSLQGPRMRERFQRFFRRFMELAITANPPLSVREFNTSAMSLQTKPFGPGSRTQENKPWGIVNVDTEGNFSTFSPELLGLSSPRHGSFALGNVFSDSLEQVMASSHFQALDSEIALGVQHCHDTCRYFPFCGGGPPANKYFENGRFDSTETLFCRLHKMTCIDVTLDLIEHATALCHDVPACETP